MSRVTLRRARAIGNRWVFSRLRDDARGDPGREVAQCIRREVHWRPFESQRLMAGPQRGP